MSSKTDQEADDETVGLKDENFNNRVVKKNGSGIGVELMVAFQNCFEGAAMAFAPNDDDDNEYQQDTNTLHEMAVQLFELFDREQRGYVLIDDINSSLGEETGLSFTQLHDIFTILDHGKTGRITLQDFTDAFVRQSFTNDNEDNDIINELTDQDKNINDEISDSSDVESILSDQLDNLDTELKPTKSLPRFILDSVDYEDEGTSEDYSEQNNFIFSTSSAFEDVNHRLISRSPPDGIETIHWNDFQTNHDYIQLDIQHSISEKNNLFCLNDHLIACHEIPIVNNIENKHNVGHNATNEIDELNRQTTPDSFEVICNTETSGVPKTNQNEEFKTLSQHTYKTERSVIGSFSSEHKHRHIRRDLRRLHSTPLSKRKPRRRSFQRGATLDLTNQHRFHSSSIGSPNGMLPSKYNNNSWNNMNGGDTSLNGICEHNNSSFDLVDNDDAQNIDINGRETEDWNSLLTRLECQALFAGNRNLRFVWQQINAYQPDLLQTFEEFLKSVAEEIQQTYVKFQELESTLNSKTDQHDRDLASVYDEMEHMLTREREVMQAKFAEREEKNRTESNRLLERKEVERTDAIKQKTEIEDRLHLLIDELNDSKSSEERLSRQLQHALGTEYNTRKENEILRQENDMLHAKLNDSKRTVMDIQDQCTNVRSILDTDKQNYRRCLRRYQDVLEEKEFLDVNLSQMSSELSELRNLNKSLQDRVDSGLNTSMLWSEEHMSPPQSPDLFIEKDEELMLPEPLSLQREVTLKEELMTNLDPLRDCNPSNVSKVVFVGDANVGKTSIIRKICRGTFQDQRVSTTVPDYVSKNIQVGDRTVALQLWDTVGQERFNSLPPSYFRKADVVVLMYDIVDDLTFINVKSWIKIIYDYASEDVLLVLVGNKLDLDHRRQVKIERAEKLSKEHDAIFVETSAKTGENVAKFCQLIASTMLENEDTLLIREASVDILNFDRRKPKSRTDRCCTG